jgi:ribose-phosphate pyrophosphokinase
MVIVGCSKGTHLAEKIARKLKKKYSELNVEKFPDGEIYVRFMQPVKGRTVVLVQSFYGNISDCILEVIFASRTAKELGVKKIYLAAPYFPYFRQDNRFNSGECVSIKVISELMSKYLDKMLIIDPHLHRQTNLSHLFSCKTVKLTANPLIADYIKKNIRNPLIVGPDWESFKWAQKVAEKIGCEHVILEKRRISGRKVKIKLNKKIDITDKTIVFVDDIISTGNTIREAARNIKKLGAKSFCCVAVHGVFVEGALERLRKARVKVVTTNTIPNKVAKIDVSRLVAEALRK